MGGRGDQRMVKARSSCVGFGMVTVVSDRRVLPSRARRIVNKESVTDTDLLFQRDVATELPENGRIIFGL